LALSAGRLAAVLLLLAGAARAEGVPPCPAGRPEIRMSIDDPAPVVSQALGVDALHGETGQKRSPGLHHLALTASRVEWRSEIETRYREDAGGVCARPARIALRLVQAEHVVRIAGEIGRGGCLWREVLAHEMRHVGVNRQTLRAAAERARAAAEAWALQAEGRGATFDAAMAGLQEGLRQAIEPALAGMREAREAAHGRIDSRAEYERLGEVCPADQRRLREALRAAGTP
jgi:hypothetical protein